MVGTARPAILGAHGRGAQAPELSTPQEAVLQRGGGHRAESGCFAGPPPALGNKA